jgi:transposase
MCADRPWGVAHVRGQRRVRTCVWANAQVPRRIVTERRPAVVAPWARRRRRLAAWLIAIGLTRVGAAGARLRRRLGHTVSRQPLLRVVRRRPLPCGSTPQV